MYGSTELLVHRSIPRSLYYRNTVITIGLTPYDLRSIRFLLSNIYYIDNI